MASSTNQLLSQPIGNALDYNGFWHMLTIHVEYLRSKNFAEATVRSRVIYLKRFTLWCISQELLRPADVTPCEMEAYQFFLYRFKKTNGKPLSWGSQCLHLQQVKMFFRYLLKAKFIQSDPSSEIEFPRRPRTLPNSILSVTEVERVLSQPNIDTPYGLRDRAILEVLYSSGLRRAELCRLTMEDVDVLRRSLFVCCGKGQKDRFVPLGFRAIHWIERYCLHARPKLLGSESDNRLLFLTLNGKALSPDSLTEYAKRYLRSAGIRKKGACHIFRHTMATLMLENGADLRYIQAILGHERLETTQIYTRTALAKLKDIHRSTHPAEIAFCLEGFK